MHSQPEHCRVGYIDSLRIAVLGGGSSAERKISLESGANVAAALREAGHRADLIDPSETELAEVAWSQYDVCFVALHGGAGEDGRIQRRLELLRIPYTGSGPDASRLAMSKSASKERFRQAGVPTAEYLLLEARGDRRRLTARLVEFGLPLAIKPDSQGSSLGVSIVREAGEIEAALDAAARYDDYALAERFIAGREFTVSLVDGAPLPTIEILPAATFFDYEAKYHSCATRYDLAPAMSGVARRRIEAVATGAARSLGVSGLARVDIMLDQRDGAWALEVNTIPGMTGHSLSPMAAARAGLSRSQLCERLVLSALNLNLRKSRRTASSRPSVGRPGSSLAQDAVVTSCLAAEAAR